MNIPNTINTGKHLCRKSLPAKKISPGRLYSCAKLSGVKGTEHQRSQLASELNDKLFALIHGVFAQKIMLNKKPSINKAEIMRCIKKVVPKAKINIIYNKKQRTAGYIDTFADVATSKVLGYQLGLKGAIKTGEDEIVLRHEMKHFFDYITQPKLIARSNTLSIVGKLENYTKKKDKMHFDFYSKILYKPKKYKNDEKAMDYLKGQLSTYFDENPTPPAEKIEVLQNWRTNLKCELSAYTDETKCLSDCQEELDGAAKEVNEFFFFEPKIKLIEQMLKEEISAVRKESARKYS